MQLNANNAAASPLAARPHGLSIDDPTMGTIDMLTLQSIRQVVAI